MVDLFQTLTVEIAFRGKGVFLPLDLGEQVCEIEAPDPGQDGMFFGIPPVFPETLCC